MGARMPDSERLETTLPSDRVLTRPPGPRAPGAEAAASPVQRRLLLPLATVFLLLIAGFAGVLTSIQRRALQQSTQRIRGIVVNELTESLAEQSRTLGALLECCHPCHARDDQITKETVVLIPQIRPGGQPKLKS